MESLECLLMFQSWPSVKIYKHETETQMFNKCYNKVNKNEIVNHMANNFDEDEPKSKNVATSFRNKGNNSFKILDYQTAIQMYNTSISRAPRDSTEFALAVANRSAVLFDMKKYKECLSDINIVLKSEYPKNLMYKLFLRQSKCYVEMNLMPEAVEALNKTKESFETEKKSLGTIQIGIMNDNINAVEAEITEKKDKPQISPENNNNFIPQLTDGENPKYLNASNLITFSFNSINERYVKATRDIKQGDVLFVEKPYATSVLEVDEYKYSTCSYCFKSSLNCVPCATCTKTFYCSNNCQLKSWELNHKWECYNERYQIIIDHRKKLALSMLLKASHDGFNTEIADTSIYGNKDNNYPYVDKLLTNKHKVSASALQYDTKGAVWIVLYLSKFTDYFNWLYVHPNRPAGSKEDLVNKVGSYLVKYLFQIRCHMDFITKGSIKNPSGCDIKLSFVGVGVGIFLSSTLLNHSCLPNAAVIYYNDVKVVKALKDIKPGTEVVINYLPGQVQDDEKKKRDIYLNRFMIKCACEACSNPRYDQQFAPYLCFRCRGKAFPFRGHQLKCSNCQLIMNKNKYHGRNEVKIMSLITVMAHHFNFPQKNTLYNLLKKTFHRDCNLYPVYYTLCRKGFEENGEFHKCYEPLMCFVESTESIYGNPSREYLLSIIQATFLFVFYSNILKKQNSDAYEKFATQTQEFLQKAIKCLQFYLNQEGIDSFTATINDFITSGKTIMFEDSDDDYDDFEDDDEEGLSFGQLFVLYCMLNN